MSEPDDQSAAAGHASRPLGRRKRTWHAGLTILAFAVTQLLIYVVVFRLLHRGGLFWDRRLSSSLSAGLVAVILPTYALLLPYRRSLTLPRARLLPWVILLSLMLTVVVGVGALQSFPGSGDEYADLFQTWTYEAGRLWNAPPPLGRAMASSYTWVTPTKWAGQYPPGWPLLMLVGVVARLPGWTVNLPLLGLATGVLFDLVRRRSDAVVATAAAAVFALSPFTIFNAGSYFPHLAAATLVLLVFWSADRLVERPTSSRALLLGAALGALGVTRTLDVPIVLLPLAFMLARHRWFWTRTLWWIGLGGLPFLGGLLWYQAQLTGHPLTSTYYLGGRTEDHLFLDQASLRAGLKLTVKRLANLSLWLSPALVALWAVALLVKARHGALRSFDVVLPITIAVLLFYPLDGGNSYGPRYYFDVWAGLPYTVATAYPLFASRLRSVAGPVIMVTPINSLILTAFLFADYRMIVTERRDIYDGAATLPRQASIVCFRSSSGLHLPLLTMDLARNGIRAAGDTLYVRCAPGVPEAARKAYPGRRLWFYDRHEQERYGRFTAK